jgi:hypothetical protein
MPILLVFLLVLSHKLEMVDALLLTDGMVHTKKSCQ